MIVNEVKLAPIPEVPTLTSSWFLRGVKGEGRIIEGLLAPEECSAILSQLDAHLWEPVSIHGMKKDYHHGDPIGSTRLTARSEDLAARLFSRFLLHTPRFRKFSEASATDWDSHPLWRPVGVNELFRFIRYEDGGQLVTHYDGPYVIDGSRRTLQSLVIYLDADPRLRGAGTRFVRDPQGSMPVSQRDLSDWDRVARPEEVVLRLRPAPGTGLVFDHRILHDGEPASGPGRKTLLRTDIVWKKA